MLPVRTEGGQFGRYRILERLAAGGTAEVFRAAMIQPDGREQPVVLKRMLLQYSRDDRVRRLFLAEAELLSSLSHPGVVKLLDYGELGGELFLALEPVDGASLHALLVWARQRRIGLKPALAAHVACELCAALDHVHSCVDDKGRPLKIVHRDVSPQNLLLSRSGEVKLTDFGIARSALREVTQVGIEGNLPYMAPEQAFTSEVDQRGDLFGVGAVLHEALFDAPPFEAATEQELLELVRRGQIRLDPSRLPPEHRPLLAIVQRCLQRRPEDRHASARELGLDLSRYLGGVESSGTAVLRLALSAWVGSVMPAASGPGTEARLAAQLLGGHPQETALVARRQVVAGEPTVDDDSLTISTLDGPATAVSARAPRSSSGPTRPGTTLAVEDLVGKLLSGTYRLIRLMKSGGMGVIYEAEHSRLQSLRCAVKVLPWSDLSGARYARFQREAEIIANLRHPNVVQVIDFNRTDEGLPYLVMELLEGEDLEGRLRRTGRLGPGELLTLLREVGSALALAHSRAVVHRDLKPGNIFLARDGDGSIRTKLLDFGISRNIAPDRNSQVTRGPMIMGTSAYMSPEQARGEDTVDHRSDIFSLATVAYRCLTGMRPFEGESPVEIRDAVCHEEAAPIARHLPGVPAAVQAALARAHAKRPADRHQSVDELVQELAAALSTMKGVPTRPDDSSELTEPPLELSPALLEATTQPPLAHAPGLDGRRRHRPALLLTLALTFLVATVVGVLVATWERQPSRPLAASADRGLSRPPRPDHAAPRPEGPPASRPAVPASTPASRPAPGEPGEPPAGAEIDVRRPVPAPRSRPPRIRRRPAEKPASKDAKRPFLRYDDI